LNIVATIMFEYLTNTNVIIVYDTTQFLGTRFMLL